MRLKPLALAIVAVGLGACGSTSTSGEQPAPLLSAVGAPAGTPAPLLTVGPGTRPPQTLNLLEPIHIATACEHDGESLAQLVGGTRRGAAIVSVLSMGPAVWNTPTGARPTQADLSAPRTTDLGIYTTYRLRIGRVLHPYPGLSADESITAYLLGGKLGSDFVQNGCGPNPAPHVGWTAVVLFGDEFPTPAAPSTPVARPVIDQLDVIQGGQASTWNGPQPVPTPQ